jgi:broad-specificity NMP kinase
MVQQVCQRCGAFSTDGPVSGDGPGWAVVTCPVCGHGTSFRRLPLFVVTGASGAGKTTTCELLLHTFPDVVVLESDVLLAALNSFAVDDIQRYWNHWVRLVVHLHQASKPVLLCGTVLPRHLESAPDRDGLDAVHYLALTCEDAELERRLSARPAWREWNDDRIAEHVRFNRWWRDQEIRDGREGEDAPSVDIHDTTGVSPERTADMVRIWVRQRLSS